MLDFTTFATILLLFLILVPGYLSWWTACSNIPGAAARIAKGNALRTILMSILFGSISFLIFLFFILILFQIFGIQVYDIFFATDEFIKTPLAWKSNWFLMLIILPTIFSVILYHFFLVPFFVGQIARKWLNMHEQNEAAGLSRSQLIDSAWDWFFFKKFDTPILAIVQLKDGDTFVAGFGENSFVTSTSKAGDIYFERLYEISDDPDDNDFSNIQQSIAKDDLGIWVARDSISNIEFRKID